MCRLQRSAVWDEGLRGAADSALQLSNTVQTTFEDIYARKLWGGDGDGSGSGSRISATGGARQILELVVLKYGLTSITDSPCGAMRWMPLALRRIGASVPCLRYTGVDVVRTVVAAARDKVAGVLPPGQASFLVRTRALPNVCPMRLIRETVTRNNTFVVFAQVWDLSAAPLPPAAAHELVLCRDALQVRQYAPCC
jgi:hypothetical protein